MVVVGITGRRSHAAAAVAVDGRIVSAVSEAALTRIVRAGYREHGFPAPAVAACLAIAGLAADRVDMVVSADGPDGDRALSRSGARGWCQRELTRAERRRVGRLDAHMRLGLSVSTGPVVVSADMQFGAATTAALAGPAPSSVPLPGLSAHLSLARRVATALGLEIGDPAEVLPRLELVARSEPHPTRIAFESLAASGPDADVLIDLRGFESELAQAHAAFGDGLRDASCPLVKVQRARAELADGFLSSLAASIARVLEARAAARDADGVTLAGSVFADPDFNARIQARTSRPVTIAPAPTPEGAALGAALYPFAARETAPWPDHLALGPSFTEPEAKAALENCRLDYVYEPSWPRLMERISRILSRGKLVAWFQQAAEFCTLVGGSRSILCDPSDRYARDNVNRFLRHQADAAPIGVSVPVDASDCVSMDVRAPWMMTRATIAPGARDRLRAAVDATGTAHVHVVPAGNPHLLHDLLVTHWRRTGVPGLLNTALQGVAEPVACSPRDAIRTAYSSAVDAMVIHRFLVMKDYWQMRSEDA